ncbi:hypothetical protein [Peribacillus sp. SCS-37]|uniref:hypothetical protein n=1 Tax=Paraperibacillus esterisolvens TaxID=3115296 RepID=UPI0039066C3D
MPQHDYDKNEEKGSRAKPGQEYSREAEEKDNGLNNNDLYEKMGDNPDHNRIKDDYQGN